MADQENKREIRPPLGKRNGSLCVRLEQKGEGGAGTSRTAVIALPSEKQNRVVGRWSKAGATIVACGGGVALVSSGTWRLDVADVGTAAL